MHLNSSLSLIWILKRFASNDMRNLLEYKQLGMKEFCPSGKWKSREVFHMQTATQITVQVHSIDITIKTVKIINLEIVRSAHCIIVIIVQKNHRKTMYQFHFSKQFKTNCKINKNSYSLSAQWRRECMAQ